MASAYDSASRASLRAFFNDYQEASCFVSFQQKKEEDFSAKSDDWLKNKSNIFLSLTCLPFLDVVGNASSFLVVIFTA